MREIAPTGGNFRGAGPGAAALPKSLMLQALRCGGALESDGPIFCTAYIVWAEGPASGRCVFWNRV